MKTVGVAVAERVMGKGPGRTRALAASVATGMAAAAAMYRLLRSHPADSGSDSD